MTSDCFNSFSRFILRSAREPSRWFVATQKPLLAPWQSCLQLPIVSTRRRRKLWDGDFMQSSMSGLLAICPSGKQKPLLTLSTQKGMFRKRGLRQIQRDLDRKITKSTQASRNLELWRFVTPDSFLLFDLLGWSKEDLDLFLQPCSTWRAAEKFNHFCILAENISLLNDNVERCKISHVLKMQYIFRLIKLVKDRIRTVHAEHRLQDVLITVAALRKRSAGFKASDFNIHELRTAIRQVMKL